MHRILSILNLKVSARRAGLALVGAALALSFTHCKNESMPAPDTGRDYYPVAVGKYWTYAVVDTTWSPASRGTPSVPTRTAYQFKETITETFTDAAGKTAYRLVRSKLQAPSTTFVNDSVFVLSATPQSVVLNRNNVRTLELIFPVKEGRLWNINAYNNNSDDTTMTSETRRYSRVGQPFAIAASTGIPAQTFPASLTTTNAGLAAESSLAKQVSYQQVFAKGVGPVFRRRVNLQAFTYVDTNNNNNQVYPPKSYSIGFSRNETLIDYGPR
ncbi:hypothetical protein ACFQT0_16605 [Hymenobacter humi]|uniref:Uncharacterized protein n=1 Tax=Hymenobacter humi TaxID=1411620 RepID=A0ABW2U5T1_9BACT